MTTPSITLAQVTATIAAVLALVAAFGLNLTKTETDAILQVVTVGYPAALAADALIRHGRSQSVAAAHNLAAAQIKAAGPDVTQTPTA